ncbi:TIR domain-containing protein [Nitrosomonas sp. Nm33]|uniref:TIR domain-containing protein n=1 Tax=Nitrosomonas sp. Nm33 TaxID=133724 RepID=UPI00089CFA9A|nr:nucleotide-binding protein [Nitrosomonas sp. Nm33]SDY19590.1 Predicted nucleotide-binding protein containing TIR-like domain-containing protein [Nitrosomonas sp. Nm33]
MKPKIFIGSSVEGLNVAYAIQQNLTYDAEATVWDQGVFELSKTTIESLDQVLNIVDFGVFVFHPDDEIKMRGKNSKTIRDNVLFELGLFIGKLGRDRVFFVIPDGVNIHIPSDLIGITPGKYNPHREDGSLQAASGAVCSQIRNQIKKLGLIRPVTEKDIAEDSTKRQNESTDDWINNFINKDYKLAKVKLEKALSEKSGVELLKCQASLSYINFKINNKEGLHDLDELAKKIKTTQKFLSLFANFCTGRIITKKQ